MTSPKAHPGTGNGTRVPGRYHLTLADEPPPAGHKTSPAQTSPARGGRPSSPRRQLPPRTVASDSHRPHGTYVKYVVERCGCGPCRQANRDYERRRHRAMTRPDEVWAPYIDSKPARRHLARLADAGVGLKQVAAVTGIAHGALSKLVCDSTRGQAPSKRIRPATARRILAVSPADVAGGAKIDGAATWALIDQLLHAGYTKTWIAEKLGRRVGNLRRRPQVRAATAVAIAQLHRRHIDTPPPPRNTRWGPR